LTSFAGLVIFQTFFVAINLKTRLSSCFRHLKAPETGRAAIQLTAGDAFCYPLYYFIPSFTPEEDRMVFHSERSGSVQLYSMDTTSGKITQLTDGHTADSNWKIWCPRPTTGIYDHLSVLNGPRREVCYFQDAEIRTTHLDTLENRKLHSLGDRLTDRSQLAARRDDELFRLNWGNGQKKQGAGQSG